MGAAVNNLHEFEGFRLDEQRRVVLRGQEPVPLTPKALETLLVLVQNSGQVVTKDELMKAVWPDSFVEESNLTQTIFVLRKALGETRDKRYILTVPGRGYRFAAEVRQVSPNVHTAAESLTPPGDIQGRLRAAQPLSRRFPVLLGIAVVLAALGAYVQWSRSRPAPSPPGGKVMLAVLPFENLTGDAAQDYFSDGLTEEMITQLGNLNPHRLGVIARTSVMLQTQPAAIGPDWS